MVDLRAVLLVAGLLGTCEASAQQPPETVRSEMISPVRPGTPLTARDLIELAHIGGARTGLFPSPDGATLLFPVRQASLDHDTIQISWWTAPADGSAPATLLADGGEPLPDILDDGRPSGSPLDSRAAWSPSGNAVAIIRSVNGRAALVVVSLHGGEPTTVFDGDGDIIDLRWEDGNRLLFRVREQPGIDQAEREQGFLFDGRFAPSASLTPLRANLDQPIIRTFVWTGDTAPTPHDEWLARDTANIPDAARLRSQSAHGAAWAEPANADDAGYFAPLRLHARLEGAETIACPDPACVGLVDQVFWSNDGSEIYFVTREGWAGSSRALRAWNLVGGPVRLIATTRDMITGCVDTAAAIACLREAPTAPRSVIAIDRHSGHFSTLFDANSHFAHASYERVDRLFARDAFGNESFAHLVYPRGYRAGRRYPLVVVQYRWRGFLNGGTGGEYPIHLFAQQGYFVLEIDRPEDRANGAQLRADALQALYSEDAYIRRMSLSALQSYVDALTERGLIDPQRIGVTGLSDGADSVFYALMNTRLFAAAIVSTPPSDPFDYFLASEDNRAYLRDALAIGDPFESGDAHWRRISPFYHVKSIHTPLLMQLAQGEFLRAMPFYTRMRDANRPVEMRVFENEFHIKQQPRHLEAIHARNLAWFAFWFDDAEGLATVPAAELDRWRTLRTQANAMQR